MQPELPAPRDCVIRRTITTVALWLSIAMGVWTLTLIVFGGIDAQIAGVRISSNDFRRTLLYGAVLLTVYTLAGGSLGSRTLVRTLRSRLYAVGVRFLAFTVHVPAGVAIVASCLLLRQWASGQTMWLDEEMIALNLRDRSLVDLPGLLWLGQTAPLGWLVIQRVMLVTFGTGELSLRFMPVVFGIATLTTAVWIGRRWMNPFSATILTLLCALSYWFAYYFVELKQYSSDTFWALLLPALAAAAVEPTRESSTISSGRIAAWWATAAVGQWFAVGALLVTPACGLVLVATALRRGGWAAAAKAALPGLGWLIVFGLHYFLSLRQASGSEYLQGYWAAMMPPASAGILGTVSWLINQLGPLALKPGGAEWWGTFWLAAGIGFSLFWKRSGLGLVFGLVGLSGFIWAAFRLVPLSERVSLWMIPALYVGIALCVEGAIRIIRHAYSPRRWTTLGAAALAGFVGLSASMDIFRGAHGLTEGRGSTNHDLDDRTAVRWLMAHRQSGDALMSTHFGLPALWWYGGIPIWMPTVGGSQLPDGGPIFKLSYAFRPCRNTQFAEALRHQRRVMIYLGFRFDDVPKGFDDLAWLRLRELGSIPVYREFPGQSRVLILDRAPDAAPSVEFAGAPLPTADLSRLDGCLYVERARRD